MKKYIGCSGFHYKHWRGEFYPQEMPVRKWFDFYSKQFDTLELNVTFYRFPTQQMLENWYVKSPDSFSFSVKVPRLITHYKKLHEARDVINDFYKLAANGLREKLGCVLFQFPPNFTFTAENMERVVRNLHPGFKNVVEFRHVSWWDQEVYDQLHAHGIGFCSMSHPDFPDEIISNAAHVYYRLHGQTQLYASDYPEGQLNAFAGKLNRLTNVKEAYIYFNNDINGYAPKNAAYLRAIT